MGTGMHKGMEVIDWIGSVNYKVKFVYEEIEGEVEIIGYDKTSRELRLKYKEINDFIINQGAFAKCAIGRLLGKVTINFKLEIGQNIKDSKRDLTITDREHRRRSQPNRTSVINDKWYKYTCNKCGWTEGWVIENILMHGTGCACCCISPSVVVEGINDIPTTDPWMIKYFQGGCDEAKLYTRASGKKIKAICDICGQVREKEISIHQIYCNKSISCYCSDGVSYPNKFMYSLLKQMNIDFKVEYSPNWIKPKRYDFYFKLDSKEYVVEMDGGFHFMDNKMNGQTFDEVSDNDRDKKEKARLNGLTLIRINCIKSKLDFIKENIISSDLSSILDLSKVDWLKCEEFALNSLVKIAYDLKTNNPKMTANSISRIMDVSNVTIGKYLKKGIRIWGELPKQQITNIKIWKGWLLRIFQNIVWIALAKGYLVTKTN